MTSSGSQVKKNSKEFRFFHFDGEAISNILDKLQYPKLQEYCYHCSKEANQNNSLSCHCCLRTLHKQCKNFENLHHSQLCRFSTTNMCLKCNITFFENQTKVNCSICSKYQHIQCCNMPFQLNKHMKKFENHLYDKIAGFNRVVCEQCQKQWGVDSQIMMNVNIQNKKYFLVKVNHPSPTHYTWLTASQYNLIVWKNIEQDLVIVKNQKPKIENIFSIHLIQKYNTVTLGCLYTLLQQEKIQNDKYNHIVYFLVKWQDGDLLVWQTLQTVRPFQQHLRNFFIQMNFNWMKFKQIQQQKVTLFLQYLMIDELVDKKANFLGNNTINENKLQEDNHNNQLEKVYHLYSKQKKQSLIQKRKDDSKKFSLVCSLINTILFIKKQLRPIFIFTSSNNLKLWFNTLATHCPFHKCLMVTGLEQNLQILMSNHFYSSRHNKNIFYNSIYVFDYNSFEAILHFFSFKQVINLSTLVIMQDEISFFAKNFYDACEVSKIKIVNRSLQTDLSLQIQSLSEKNNTISDSCLNSRNEKNYYEYLNRDLKTRKEQISSKYQNKQLFNECLFNELQRLSFLRFIMLFGLQFQNTKGFIQQLLLFDKQTFSTENKAQISPKIQCYIKMFLTVVSSNLRTQQLPLQIVNFCCFGIEPYEIFERIMLLNYMKKIVKRNRKDLMSMKPLSFNKQTFSTSIEFHLMVFEVVLVNGFGKWESICEYSKIWEERISKMSLRQYFSLKTGLIIRLPAFCLLVKNLLIKFWTNFKRSNNFI